VIDLVNKLEIENVGLVTGRIGTWCNWKRLMIKI
jgi:hypothetical protein